LGEGALEYDQESSHWVGYSDRPIREAGRTIFGLIDILKTVVVRKKEECTAIGQVRKDMLN